MNFRDRIRRFERASCDMPSHSVAIGTYLALGDAPYRGCGPDGRYCRCSMVLHQDTGV